MQVIKPYRRIPKEEIERQALDVLEFVQAKRKRPLKWPPIDPNIVADEIDLNVVWFPIEPDEKGSIAAMILPLDCKIVINQNNTDQVPIGFQASTLAHEIGHWVLHIDQNSVDIFKDRQENGIEISIEPFLCRSVSSQQGIEWQAQYFASCLLMPKDILEKKRKGRDLTKWSHLYAMADEFGVTISNLKNRLQDIGWIYIPKGSKQIYLGNSGNKTI